MALTSRKVYEVVDDAVKGTVNIPEFQRGFVWRSDQVRDLIDSLHRGYPVGSMLVWDASDYVESHGAAGAPTTQWIVDGQQRTTALCIAFGVKPYWWPDAASWNKKLEQVDILANLANNDDHVEFALANPVRRRDPSWFSVRRALHCRSAEDATDLGIAVATERGAASGSPQFKRTLGLVNSLWAIRAGELPVISVTQDLEDVAEIFARLNQAGTRVTEADVTVALVAAFNPGWVRDEFLEFTRAMADIGFDLEPGVYIRTITGIVQGTARLKDVSSSFWRDRVRDAWPQARQAIAHTVHLLADRGLSSAELLPSRNALIPLFVLHARFKDELSFSPAFRWFLLANADGRYSGSAVTTLTQDLATIWHGTDSAAVLDELLRPLRVSPTLEASRFLEDYSRDRFGRLLLYLLLFDREAVDWVSKVQIGFRRADPAVARGFLPQWHHIFPRSALRDYGVSDEDANVLANMTVLNEVTNQHKLQAKVPEQYVAAFRITPEELRGHLIPDGIGMQVSDFFDFVMRRAELLADAANQYLARLAAT